MERYEIKILSKARGDLDGIYRYIAQSKMAPEAAESLLDDLEGAIFSLEELPERGALRKHGAYKDKKYRQLFVKSYSIVYRIDQARKEVVIVTVQHQSRNF